MPSTADPKSGQGSFTIDIQVERGTKIRDITSSDGIRVLAGQGGQIVITASRDDEFPSVILQLVVNQQEFSRETFTPCMCAMACGSDGCDPKDVTGEIIQLSAECVPWMVSYLNCELANRRTFSVAF